MTVVTSLFLPIPYVKENELGEWMDNGKLKTILTWAGIAALVAIPVVVLLKKRKEEPGEAVMEDDSNIFASELEE